jgi:hypothetical protein
VHDEFFQGATLVLAGVDAASTYCYRLARAEHRDTDTGVCIYSNSNQVATAPASDGAEG